MGAAAGLLINGSVNNGAATPFALDTADPVGVTAPPSDRELSILRALDPKRQFLGGAA